jgi:hypothetical protein
VVTAAATVRISAAAADADVLAAAAMAGDAADAVSATAVAVTSLLQSTLLRKARTVVPTAAQIGEMIAVIRTADLVATSTIVVPRARAPVLRQNPRKSRLCSLVNRWRNIVAGQLPKLPLPRLWPSRSASNRGRKRTNRSLA